MRDSTKTYVVDANVILRFLTRDHEVLWKRSVEVVEAMEAGRIQLLCDPVTLSEVVFVLGSFYKLTGEHISQILKPILQADGFHVPDKQRYLRALDLFATSVPHFGDACACAAALEECEGRLVSFDKRLSGVDGVVRTEEV